MQDLKIALLQFDQVWENKRANWDKIEKLLQEFESGDLLILPEMFDTGFSMNTALAEDWGKENSSLCFLNKLASQYHCAIYTSCMVKENGSFINRGVFIKSNGAFEVYDKRKGFGLGGEDLYFRSGSSETIVDFKGWKLNLQICYDLRFPELIRNRIIHERPAYDVLIYVANWPEKRVEHWKTLLKARAIENQCFVLGVNRIGRDGNSLNYSGDSIVYDALGNNLVGTEPKERLIYTILNYNELNNIRTSLPFLKDR
jgi:predicted amidohydrolase